VKNLNRSVGAALAISALLLVLSGCENPEGPAERAGKEVDQAAEKAGQQIQEAGESIKNAARGDKK